MSRVFVAGVSGAGLSALLFALSRTGGYYGPVAVFLSIAVFGLAVGLVVAHLVERLLDDSAGDRSPKPPGGTGRPRLSPATGSERCATCRREMHQLGVVWVCAQCDLIPG